MDDWRSYDAIADAYARVWSPRFETLAKHLLALAPPLEGLRLLDLGTGTGAVASALGDRLANLRTVVGCDLSRPMLIRARRGLPELRVLVTDVGRLPFRRSSFDLATANCVLSHLLDYRQALTEVLRVLARPGHFIMSSWGPSLDPYAATWRELLDGAVGEDTTQRTVEEVAPSERHLSSAENVRTALREAGFGAVRVEVIEISHHCSVEEYLLDRELSSGGRFGRHALGDAGWRGFLERTRGEFRTRFGDRVSYERPVVLGVAKLP